MDYLKFILGTKNKYKSFQFKKFEIDHRVNAQKIGTDSVLLAAWANFNNAKRVLDIGSGSGVITLMAAQRTGDETEIVAVEIEEPFYQEGKNNFERSIFKNKIKAYNCDVKELVCEGFDHIICNPPYFNDSLKSPDHGRVSARHTVHLDYEKLAVHIDRLLLPTGKVSLVIPAANLSLLEKPFIEKRIFPFRRCEIFHHEETPVSIVFIEFSRVDVESVDNEKMSIRNGGDYSEKFKSLLKEFLIIF